MTPSAFTITSLHTIGGTSLAVLVLMHVMKQVPGVRRMSYFWMSILYAPLIYGLASPSLPTDIAQWAVLFLNGLLSAIAATGSLHLVVKVQKIGCREVTEVVEERVDDVDDFERLLRAVIRKQAFSYRRKYCRWQRDLLIMDAPDSVQGIPLCDKLYSFHADDTFRESEIRLLINEMPHPNREVMYDLFILGYSQEQVAQMLHISQQHVSRIKQREIKRLRQELGHI